MPADAQSTPAGAALRAAYGDDAFGDLTDAQVEQAVRARLQRGLPPLPWTRDTWEGIDGAVSRLKSERTGPPQTDTDAMRSRIDAEVERLKRERRAQADTAPRRPSRFGLATSVVQPELEDLRSAISDGLQTPPGRPVMARSRTGTLYPSETSTGAVDNAKAFTRGASGVGIDTAENATSPLGLALGALGTRAGRALTGTTLNVAGKASGAAGRGLEGIGNTIEKPANLVSLIELLHNPRASLAAFAAPYAARTGGDVLQRVGRVLGYLGELAREVDNPTIPTEGRYVPSPNAPNLHVYTRVPITKPPGN